MRHAVSIRSLVPGLLLPGLLLLGSCSSTETSKTGIESFIPDGKNTEVDAWRVEDQSVALDSTVGVTIAMLDKQITAWNNYELGAKDELDRAAQRRIATKIAADTSKKFSIVEQQLSSGSIYNRQVAAMALGFTENPRALPPLLLALEDREPAVVANAALGLSRLALKETDLSPLLALIELDQPMRVRVNASLAIKNVIKAGHPGTDAAAALRRGLLDEEPGVRVHCGLALAHLGDAEAIPDLILLLQDPVPLVMRVASAAIVTIGSLDPHAKGRAARGLAGALQDAKGDREELLIQSLQVLSGRNYGDNKNEWLRWAVNNTPEN